MSSAHPSDILWEIIPFRFSNEVVPHIPGLPLDFDEFAGVESDE